MRKNTPEYVKTLAKELRKEQTAAEAVLWQRLRGKKLEGLKFRRQYCFGRYIADFYCSSAKLIIEIDGDIHEQSDRIEYDKIREKEIVEQGVRIIRFSNEQVLKNSDSVINAIYDTIRSDR